MSNITKNSKIGIFAVMFIAAALIGSVLTIGDNIAFATKKHNDAEQEIEQDFNEALKDIRKLPKSSRRGVYLAYQYYRELFKKIKLASACVVFSKRFRISNGSKLILIFDTLLKHQLNYL